jgi:hypothetical protein
MVLNSCVDWMRRSDNVCFTLECQMIGWIVLTHGSVPGCTRPSKSDADLGWRGKAEVRPCESGGVTWAELCSSLESSTARYEIYHALTSTILVFDFIFLLFLFVHMSFGHQAGCYSIHIVTREGAIKREAYRSQGWVLM